MTVADAERLRRHIVSITDAAVDPQLANPPLRSALDFRLGVISSFYQRLSSELRVAEARMPNGQTWYPYEGLASRPDEDWIGALLMAWASAGDILCFYQERLINEGYLRTAQQPESLQQLLASLGIRRTGGGFPGTAPGPGPAPTAKPGGSAAPVPVTLDPGCAAIADLVLGFAGVRGGPTRIILTEGSLVRTLLAGGGFDFLETDHAIVARREWSAMSVWQPPAPRPESLSVTAPGVLLAGTDTGLRPGDIILCVGTGGDGNPVHALRAVSTVQVLTALSLTEVTWAPAVPDRPGTGAIGQPKLYRFARRTGLFGADSAVLATLPRRRRLDQGVDAGGVMVYPAGAFGAPEPAAGMEPTRLNAGLPTADFTAVLALPGGGVCLGTEEGIFIPGIAEGGWTAARSGMPPRQVVTLARDLDGAILAGTTRGGVFRTTNPAIGWDSLAGGFTVSRSRGRNVPVKAALPSESVRRLASVKNFPGNLGGGETGVVALTDSGLYVWLPPGGWFRVVLDETAPRSVDFLFGRRADTVALCTSTGVRRLKVKGAVPQDSEPPKRPSKGLFGFLKDEEAAVAGAIGAAGKRLLLEPGRIYALGDRTLAAMAPLTDAAGDGDLLVAASSGAIVVDAKGRMWEASAGLPRDAAGKPVGVAQLTPCGQGAERFALGVAGGDIYRFTPGSGPADGRWTKALSLPVAEGPPFLSVADDGQVVVAQTPVPATQWPLFPLSATPLPPPGGDPSAAPPSAPGDPAPIPLDLDNPALAVAPGSMVVLLDRTTPANAAKATGPQPAAPTRAPADPSTAADGAGPAPLVPVGEPADGGRFAAGAVVATAAPLLDAFGLTRRVCRAWAGLRLPDGLAVTGFDRRQSQVLVDSVELTPVGPGMALERPVGIDDRLNLAGLITDLSPEEQELASEGGASEPGSTAPLPVVRQMPRRQPLASPLDALAPPVPPRAPRPDGLRRMALTGRAASLLPAVLGGVLRFDGLSNAAGARPGRSLGYRSVIALVMDGAGIVAGCDDGRLYRTTNGKDWTADPIGTVAEGDTLVALAPGTGALWSVGQSAIAWREGSGPWTPMPPLPSGLRATCLLEDAEGIIWAGTRSGLFAASGRTGAWLPQGGGALDPGAAVTALARGPDGGLLVGTDGDGVLTTGPTRNAWAPFGGPIGRGRVNALAVADGRVLAGTPDSGAFEIESGASTWSTVGLDASLPIRAVSLGTARTGAIIAAGGGLFRRDAETSTWMELPLGLAGTVSCLLAPDGPGWPDLMVGAAALLSVAPADAAQDEASALALDTVAILPASAADLLSVGVLGSDLRARLKSAGVTVKPDAILGTLPAGRGWTLGPAGEPPLLLVPSDDGIAVLQANQPPVTVMRARQVAAAESPGDGGMLSLALSAGGGAPVAVDAYPDELLFLPAGAKAAQMALVVGIRQSEPAVDGSHTGVVLADSPGLALDPATVTANANVVQASQGRSVDEILGSGDGQTPNQRFTLAQKPLTFLPGAVPKSRVSTLSVTVEGTPWTEVVTLSGCGPHDRVYTVSVDQNGVATVTFGDGGQGARLPTGFNNIRASYRVGMGPLGDPGPPEQQPMGATVLANLMAGNAGLSKDVKLLPRTPFIPRESLMEDRLSAPRRMLMLGRLITPEDYTRFLARVPGVAKSLADSIVFPGGRQTLVLTVAPDPGTDPGAAAAMPTMIEAMLLRTQAAGARPVMVLPYAPVPVRVAARVWIEPGTDPSAIVETASAALRASLGFTARALGQDMTVDEILARLQRQTGVVGAEVQSLHPKRSPDRRADAVPAPRAGIDGEVHPARLVFLPDDADSLVLTAAVLAPGSGP